MKRLLEKLKENKPKIKSEKKTFLLKLKKKTTKVYITQRYC